MNAELIINICILTASLFGFLYGVKKTFLAKAPLYARMITGALACMMLSRLSYVIREAAGLYFPRGFHVNILGCIGIFLFLLTANMGVMDGIADDGSTRYAKYRITALAAPAVIALLYLPVLFSEQSMAYKISCAAVSAAAAYSSYYNFKHVIFPDVDFGIIKSIRSYNLAAFGLAILHMAEMIAICYEWNILLVISGLLLAADSVAILPLLLRGIRRWTV